MLVFWDKYTKKSVYLRLRSRRFSQIRADVADKIKTHLRYLLTSAQICVPNIDTMKQAAYNTISALIEKFASEIEQLKKSQNETETRIQFINPFFKALGWDVDNTATNVLISKREVVHEDRLKVEGRSKAPDYSFRIDGKRRFFLEAKKPSVEIKTELPPAYQLRRYGWSAKLPISILTDFEEFALYDCTKRPKDTDLPTVGRLKYLTYDQYLANFDWIWAHFAKENVVKGSLDKFAKTDKKGTDSVDTAFLQSLDEWRNLLASNIALRNKDLDEEQINFLVQINLNRIVFLRNCEDRNVEPYNNLKDCLRNAKVEGSYFKNLYNLFQEADQKYNSGLFDFKKDNLSANLIIDNQVISTIISELYYPKSPYEFSVIGVEILGTAYERFLGKVIRLTANHQAKVEEKPEVRKAGGVFYTPQYIVEYIVINTIGKLIAGKTPEEIALLKICDPACGSGSFLLGAYEYLLEYHRDWYNLHYKKNKRAKDSPINEEGKLTNFAKKQILLNNIFGVDLDSQAVEVTKLSLLMKCLEGETAASLQATLTFERILPTLDNNILSGNSLIDFDFYEGQMDFVEKKIKPFNWKRAFPQVFKPRERLQLSSKLKRHYDWVMQQSAEIAQKSQALIDEYNKVKEPENNYATTNSGGFDVIIGNPPYVYLPNKATQQYFAAKYLYQDYQQDLYLLFLERYAHLLATNGLFGVIISNTWLQSVLLKKIRKYLVQNYRWIQFLHLPEKVFADAVVDTHILIFEKEKPLPIDRVKIEIYTKGEISESHELIQSELPQEGEVINLIAKPLERVLFEKIKSQSVLIKDIASVYNGVKPFEKGKGTPPQTDKIMKTKPFVKENCPKPGENWQPLLRGSLIHRYKNLWNQNSWILYGKWLAAPRDPAIFEAPEKIMVRQTGDSIIATIVGKGVIARNNLHIIIAKEPVNHAFMLGLLNSMLGNFYYRQINPEKGEALAEVKKHHVEMLPFPLNYSAKQHDEIVKNVDLLLKLHADLQTENNKAKQEMLQGRIAFATQRIDTIVYALYGLTEEEVAIIEGM